MLMFLILWLILCVTSYTLMQAYWRRAYNSWTNFDRLSCFIVSLLFGPVTTVVWILAYISWRFSMAQRVVRWLEGSAKW
jgi:hypothetical protein